MFKVKQLEEISLISTKQGEGQLRNEAEISGLAKFLNMTFDPHPIQSYTTDHPWPTKCSSRESKKKKKTPPKWQPLYFKSGEK